MKIFHVYILTNESKMLYVGVTNNMVHRIYQHRLKLVPGFTQRYNIHRLVYVETFRDVRLAIAREKEIKGWLRAKKIALIKSVNPRRRDLSEEWFQKPKRSKKVSS